MSALPGAAPSLEPVDAAVAATREDAAGAGRRGHGRALAALAVGGFAIGTGEFVVMGLLPDIARGLGRSVPEAGHAISAYALGVVVGAPALALLSAGWPRRRLLMTLLAGFALAHVACAMAPSLLALMALRFLCGLPHATYFGVAALAAVSLVPPAQRGRAVGWVMSGLTLSALLGVPLAAWLGQWLGWRSAFVGVGLVAALACTLIRFAVPALPADPQARPLRELKALARPQVWLTLAVGAIGFGGMFAVYSYIQPLLTEVGGLSLPVVPLVLALFGLGMVAGNLVGARLADRALLPGIGGLLVWGALVLVAIGFSAAHPIALCVNVLLLGTMVALGPTLQVRLMDVAGEAQTLAAALNHSAFNLANAIGAWLGGAVVTAGFGWAATGGAGALLAFGGLLVFGVSLAVPARR